MNDFLIFMGFVIGGVLAEGALLGLYLYFTKSLGMRRKFSFGRYLYLLLAPLAGVVFVANRVGPILLEVFVIFSLAGFVFEWLIGRSYHKIVGVRLWSYHHSAVTRYTSWQSLPLWGLMGVMFWLLAQVF